jgi:hypothetical protein
MPDGKGLTGDLFVTISTNLPTSSPCTSAPPASTEIRTFADLAGKLNGFSRPHLEKQRQGLAVPKFPSCNGRFCAEAHRNKCPYRDPYLPRRRFAI